MTTERQPVSFEFTTDGPVWRGIPVVNGRELLGVERMDVELDARGLPKVTMRLSVASGFKVSAATAQACLDDGTRDALIALGWTPPDGGEACPGCGSRHPEGYECTIEAGPAGG